MINLFWVKFRVYIVIEVVWYFGVMFCYCFVIVDRLVWFWDVELGVLF